MNDLNKKPTLSSGVIKSLLCIHFLLLCFLTLILNTGLFFFFSLVSGFGNIFPSLWLVLFALIN